MNEFPIGQKSHEFELSYGSYRMLFAGGWYIENLDELDIELVDILTGKTVTLKTKDFFGLRIQDRIGKQQAVVAYEFYVMKYSKFRLTIHNPEALIMKRYHPFLLLSKLIFRKPIPIDEIRVVIR